MQIHFLRIADARFVERLLYGQLRTIAMDFWASLEHKLKYKKDIVSDQLTADLKLCADESAALDLKMDRIRKEIEVLKTPLAKAEDGKSQ